MPLARDFKETMQTRAARDPAFREGLFKEGVERLLTGDVDTGRIVLRDYVNAAVGFEELGSLTGKPPKGLIRMFGPSGNPMRAISSRSSAASSSTRASASKCIPFANGQVSG